MTHDAELALADQHIVQAEGHITQQLQRIEQMEARGQDTQLQLAKDTLFAMKCALLAMQRHRLLLLAEQAEDAP